MTSDCISLNPPGSYDNAFDVASVDSASNAAWYSSRGHSLNMDFDTKVTVSSDHVRSCVRECPGEAGWVNQEEPCFITRPDISAPGMKISSSSAETDNSYRIWGGTWVASAYLTGVKAQVICANNRVGNDQLDVHTARGILTSTANTERINLEGESQVGLGNNFPIITNLLCSWSHVVCGSYPNNNYDWGEVDACAAVRKMKGIKK